MSNTSNQLAENIYIPLNDWSALKATGSDAAKFLNGFCTNDLAKLAEEDSCEAFFTDVKAHILAYTTIYRRSVDEFLIVLSSPYVEALVAHLDRYLIREKVQLEALADCCMVFTNTSTLPSTETISVPLNAYGVNASLWLGVSESQEVLVELLSKADNRSLSSDQFEQLRLSKGIPKDRVDVDDRNLPQEVDRVEQTISFTKGCYLGQEPVARIDALGQVNWLLRKLLFSTQDAPPSGTELFYDGKVVGRVTSSIATEEGAIGLGYIRRKLATVDSELTYDNGATCVVTPSE